MIPISQRLRARLEPIGDGSGKWRPDGLCQEAADINDALVAALDGLVMANEGVELALCNGPDVPGFDPMELGRAQSKVTQAEWVARAALAKAKGKKE